MDDFHFNAKDFVQLLAVSEEVEKYILKALHDNGYQSVSSIMLMRILALTSAHFISAFEEKAGDIIKLRKKFNQLVGEAYRFWKSNNSQEMAAMLKNTIGDV